MGFERVSDRFLDLATVWSTGTKEQFFFMRVQCAHFPVCDSPVCDSSLFGITQRILRLLQCTMDMVSLGTNRCYDILTTSDGRSLVSKLVPFPVGLRLPRGLYNFQGISSTCSSIFRPRRIIARPFESRFRSRYVARGITNGRLRLDVLYRMTGREVVLCEARSMC